MCKLLWILSTSPYDSIISGLCYVIACSYHMKTIICKISYGLKLAIFGYTYVRTYIILSRCFVFTPCDCFLFLKIMQSYIDPK